MTHDPSGIERAEEALRLAMLSSDVDQLSRLIHDDLMFVGPHGQVVSKRDDLALHGSGEQRITRLAIEERRLQASADLGVVSVRAAMSGVFKGQAFEGMFRYLRVWRQTASGWQVIAGSVVASPEV